MGKKLDRLLKASEAFCSEMMKRQTKNFQNNVPVCLDVEIENGASRWLTLGELREFWAAVEEVRE